MNATMPPLLELQHLSVVISGRTILRKIELQLDRGDRVVIRGPSGSGKSSLLKAILGLLPPTEGRILYGGAAIGPHNIESFRRKIGYVAQEPVLGGETGREALLLPFTFRSRRQDRPSDERIDRVLDGLGLAGSLLEQPAGSLSGGEKQRLALGRALLLGATLFLLDEVTSALDPESRKRIVTALAQSDSTVIAVSHDNAFDRDFAKRWEMRDGRLIRQEP